MWGVEEDGGPFGHGSVTSHKGFGDSVGIDGDIAFVGSQTLYRVNIDDSSEHSISIDTITVEQHDESSIQLYKSMQNLDETIII